MQGMALEWSRLSEASGLKCFPPQKRALAKVSPLRGEWIEIAKGDRLVCDKLVSPLRGEWIEISMLIHSFGGVIVSPLRGEWIEIIHIAKQRNACTSRLSEASGLKYKAYTTLAPHSRLASQRRVD